jgi:hypothetical protein
MQPIEVVASPEDLNIFSVATLGGSYILDSAVAMFEVVPVDELRSPDPGFRQVFKTTIREFRSVFGCSVQGLRIGIVIRNSWAGIRRLDPEPL